MIFEVVFETVLPVVGRFLFYVFVELIFYGLCYAVGFGFIKMVTLGKYPKQFKSEDEIEPEKPYAIMSLGMLILIVVFLILLNL